MIISAGSSASVISFSVFVAIKFFFFLKIQFLMYLPDIYYIIFYNRYPKLIFFIWMMFSNNKIDFHNFDATAAVTIAAWSAASKFLYEQFTPKIKCFIVETLDSMAEDLVDRGVIWSYKSACDLQADKVVLEMIFAESPSDMLKPKRVEIKLDCG